MVGLQKIAQGVDTQQIRHWLFVNESYWVIGKEQSGEELGKVMGLRLPVKGRFENYPLLPLVPGVRPIALALLAQVQGEELGSIRAVALAPGDTRAAQAEPGMHSYVLGISVDPGVTLTAGMDATALGTGDTWYAGSGQFIIQNYSSAPAIYLHLTYRLTDFSFVPEE